jgi:hypothetical protein
MFKNKKNLFLKILQTLKREALMVNMKINKVIYDSSFKLNIISLIVITILIYRFYSTFSFDIGLLSLIISFLISFVLTIFVLNKFEFSKNIYIGIIQRFIIYTFYFILASVLLFYILKIGLSNLISTIYCSDESISSGGEVAKDIVKVTSESIGNNPDNKDEYYNFKVKKSLLDEGLKNLGDASKFAFEKLAPNLGVGAATGTAAGAVIKYTAGMPPLQRLALIGSTAAVTATGTKVGLEFGTAVSKNLNLEEAIKNSPHADPDVTRIPSPSSLGDELDYFIRSPADITSPLQDILIYSLALDIIILILFIIILLIIFNRYIVKYNLNFFKNIIQNLQSRGINKYMPNKIINWLNISVNTSIEYNNKFVSLMLIINSIFLFLFIFLKLLISSELLINIDSYINVHNYIHNKKSSFLLLLAQPSVGDCPIRGNRGSLHKGREYCLSSRRLAKLVDKQGDNSSNNPPHPAQISRLRRPSIPLPAIARLRCSRHSTPSPALRLLRNKGKNGFP